MSKRKKGDNVSTEQNGSSAETIPTTEALVASEPGSLTVTSGNATDRMAAARAAKTAGTRTRTPRSYYLMRRDEHLGDTLISTFQNKYRLRKYLAVARTIDRTIDATTYVIRGACWSLADAIA
jgi:hypothetical protein